MSFGQAATGTFIKNDSANVIITSLNVTGNKHTKTYIILRELPFKTGDTLQKQSLAKTLLQARNQVYNTNLFTEIKIDSLILPDSSLAIQVAVKERWYIYPTPQFQLADRSFNEWRKIYHADLNRVIYGVKFAHYNFSGRRDQLRIFLLNGYARNFSASYSAPYANRALTQGLGFSSGFTQNREIGYKINYFNRLLLFRKEGFVRNAFSAAASMSKRKGFFKSNGFSLGLNYVLVNDSVITAKYNPNYFNSNKRYQFFPDLSFGVSYSNTDNNNYPLKGFAFSYGISKRGLGFSGGINSTTFSGGLAKFISHKRNFYSTIQTSGQIKIPFDQAYINLSGIGLRGLEYYLITGVANATAKYTLSKKVTSFKIPIPFKIKAFPYIPFKIFAKTYADAGYSYVPPKYNTRLNNRLLYTGGFGVDFITLYDIVFKVEYSFNQLGEKGLFLQGKSGF